MKLDQISLDTVRHDVDTLLDEHLPQLAEAMKKADSDKKAAGKLTITIEMVDDPGSDKKPRRNELVVTGKLGLPGVSCDAHKIVYKDGQMSLL